MAASMLLAFMVLSVAPEVSFARRAIAEKLVDLSHIFDETTLGWVTEKPFNLKITHRGDNKNMDWLQTEEISTGTHVGTHIDAPCHIVDGRWTLEQIPLDHFLAPAAVVDITQRVEADSNALLQVSDLLDWEKKSGQSLNDTILLLRTGWDRRWPDMASYFGNADKDISRLSYPGVSIEAAKWLAQNRNIYGLGLDSFSVDSGAKTPNGVPAHTFLYEANIYGLENVASLQLLPEFGAQLYVSPMRLGQGACGSPVRIFAMLP